MKRCPKCTSLMPDDVTRCIRCGFDSRTTAAPVAASPAAPKPAAALAAVAAPASVAPASGGRIANGWALMVQSWRALMLDKQLVVFPLLSALACLLVMASFLGGALAAGVVGADRHVNEGGAWALLFLYYFLSYFVIVFFNSALVSCVMIRFQGGTPTMRDGLRAAAERLPQIVSWALLAASVGVLLRMIEERVGFIGKIVVALLGAAWSLATYFVVPVLVVEKLGPFEAAKRSWEIIRTAWGEAIVGNVGIGLITTLAVIFLVVPCGVLSLMLAAQMQSVAVGILGAAATLTLLVLIVLASSTMSSIILSALYLYAAERKVPQAFDAGHLQAAFRAR